MLLNLTHFYRKILIVLAFCPSLFFLHAEESCAKKTILVLCSNGGYGHQAALQTLSHLIEDTYNIEVIYPIDEMKILGVQSGEQFYNFMLQSGWIKPMNFITKYIAPKLFRSRKKNIISLMKDHMTRIKPDLVLSVIPFVNSAASEAARQMQIPYLVVTVDNDLQTWAHGLNHVTHPHFKMTVSSDDLSPRKTLEKKHICSHRIQTTGLPIRHDFFTPKNAQKIKEKLNIQSHQPVILLICGGVGGKQTFEYAKHISQMPLGAHLIVCAGKNKTLAHSLEQLYLHPTNSRTVMGFTKEIADLMAISDLIITKSGPGTITEAMTMQIPILVDATSSILRWEKANIDLVEKYKVGSTIHDLSNLEPVLRKFLFDSELRHNIQKAYAYVPQNRFQELITPLIESMCLLKTHPAYNES